MPIGGLGVPRPTMQGEGHPSHVLTWDNVRGIRQEYAAGGVSHAKLARKYDVSASAVRNIIRGTHWTDPDYTPPPLRSAYTRKGN